MPFVRVFSSGMEKWFSDDTDTNSLCEQQFDAKRGRTSIYWIETLLDEVGIVAAHVLRDGKLDNKNVIRLYGADLRECGLESDGRSLGMTGVVATDHAHCEIKGDRTQLQTLTRLIFQKLKSGEDRIRAVHKSQIRRHIDLFSKLPLEKVTPFARRFCKRHLQQDVASSPVDRRQLHFPTATITNPH